MDVTPTALTEIRAQVFTDLREGKLTVSKAIQMMVQAGSSEDAARRYVFTSRSLIKRIPQGVEL